MDPTLADFATDQDSRGVSRLAVLTEFTKNLPTEKVNKISKLTVTWETDISGENLPNLSLEFFQ